MQGRLCCVCEHWIPCGLGYSVSCALLTENIKHSTDNKENLLKIELAQDTLSIFVINYHECYKKTAVRFNKMHVIC